MDKDECGPSGLWNISSYIPLDYVVISVYYRYYLQLGLCDVVYCCSAGVDWSLKILGFIKFSQTQSDGLVEVLDLYSEHTC